MCGIAGFSLYDDVTLAGCTSVTPMGWLAALGIEMQSRGKDATGYVAVDSKDVWRFDKKPIDATAYFKGVDSTADGGERTAFVHTRAWTAGHPSNPLNNHPIAYEGLLGIHNGCLFNDDELFKDHKWKRHGLVDSEAIFAAIHHLGPIPGLEAVEGSMAVAWIDTNNPHRLYLARGDYSPLYYTHFAQGLFFASTEKAAASGNSKVKVHEVDEGTLLVVERGHIVEQAKFLPMPRQITNYTWKRTINVYQVGDKVRLQGCPIIGTVEEVLSDGSYIVEWEPGYVAWDGLYDADPPPAGWGRTYDTISLDATVGVTG